MHGEIRLVKTKEADFLVSVENSMFGRKRNFIKSWKEGDCVVFVVDDFIAGSATVNGGVFTSTDPLWLEENPYRIPIKFDFAFTIGKRPSFEIHRKQLIEKYGIKWGNIFVCRQKLPENIQDSIMENIKSHKSDSNIGAIFDKIKVKIQREQKKEFDDYIEEYKEIKEKVSGKTFTFDQKKECLTKKMLDYVKENVNYLDNFLNRDSFISVLSEEEREYLSEIGYSVIKDEVDKRLTLQGHRRKEEKVFGEGTYMIVGDTHGDFTLPGMFNLLHQVNDYLHVDKIIHVGHFLDNNWIINRNWDKFSNLIIVSRLKERVRIEDYVKTRNPSVDVVKNHVVISDFKISHSELSDYADTRPGSLMIRKPPFLKSVILNEHIHNLDVARSEKEARYMQAYPGCLCEKHDTSERKGKKYTPGILERTIKDPLWTRQNSLNEVKKERWEQGLIILHVSSDGFRTLVMCRIKRIKVGDKYEFAISYFDKIITESSILNPDEKTFIVADVHAPLYDGRILDIENQIALDYVANTLVNLGDMRNSLAFNHHLEKKGVVVTESVIEEAGLVFGLLQEMKNWAKEKWYFIYGNHERFAVDWVDKRPAFKGYMEFEEMCGVEALRYQVSPLQEKLERGDVVYIHGDVMKGVSSYLDNLSGAYPNRTVVCGHHHYPSVRRGCYSVGFSGQLDQKYNETEVTRWTHGFALCNTISGVSFVTPLVIENNKIILNGKTYSSSNEKFWREKAVTLSTKPKEK